MARKMWTYYSLHTTLWALVSSLSSTDARVILNAFNSAVSA